MTLCLTGCGDKIENAYDPYANDYINGYNGMDYFSSKLCVTNDVNFVAFVSQFFKIIYAVIIFVVLAGYSFSNIFWL